MTHKQLVKRGGLWLRNTLHCGVVMEEFTACVLSNEIPDVIGWNQNRCILVECKASRADFRADQKKPHRNPIRASLGSWKFYLAPPGLIDPDELPVGWGLYEVHDRHVRHAGGAKYENARVPPFASCKQSEVGLLLSALRRLKISTCVYVREIENKCEEVEWI